jgi:hypothetical protein
MGGVVGPTDGPEVVLPVFPVLPVLPASPVLLELPESPVVEAEDPVELSELVVVGSLGDKPWQEHPSKSDTVAVGVPAPDECKRVHVRCWKWNHTRYNESCSLVCLTCIQSAKVDFMRGHRITPRGFNVSTNRSNHFHFNTSEGASTSILDVHCIYIALNSIFLPRTRFSVDSCCRLAFYGDKLVRVKDNVMSF